MEAIGNYFLDKKKGEVYILCLFNGNNVGAICLHDGKPWMLPVSVNNREEINPDEIKKIFNGGVSRFKSISKPYAMNLLMGFSEFQDNSGRF